MITEGLAGLECHQNDVCVVGSGPVGISLALELAARGKSVLILESGGRNFSSITQELSRADVLDRKAHDDMTICVSRQLGGTSNLWGGRCQPLDPVDFADRSSLTGAVWPIGFNDIAAYYEQAAVYSNCGNPIFVAPLDRLDQADDRIIATRLERFSNKPAFQKAHAASLDAQPSIAIRLDATVTNISISDEGHADSITVVDSKGNTVMLPVKTLVLAMGGLETTRLLLVAQKQQPDLFGGAGGPLGRYYMAHLVGEVADLTWADADLDAAFDFYVDGNHSYVRRRLVPSEAEIVKGDLPNVAFWPVVFPVSDPRHNSAILSLVFLAFACRPVGRLVVPEVIRRYHAPKGIAKGPHFLNVVRDLPAATRYVPSFFRRRYFDSMRLPGFFIRNRSLTYGLSFHSEHFPSPDSRVWLNDEVDARGMPRLTIDFRFARKDAEALLRAHQLLDAWLRDNRLGAIRYRQSESETAAAILKVAEHGTHQIGTTRVGESRLDGVVDRNLRAFDVDNLYVVGSSVYPTGGQANPTFTSIAFAVRLAQHLISI
jgi:choline dehydrogenase-like flavoprotein